MSTTGGLNGTLTRTLRRGSSLFHKSSGKITVGRVPVGSITQEAMGVSTQEAKAMSTKEAMEVSTKEATKGKSSTRASREGYGGRSTKTGKTMQVE